MPDATPASPPGGRVPGLARYTGAVSIESTSSGGRPGARAPRRVRRAPGRAGARSVLAAAACLVLAGPAAGQGPARVQLEVRGVSGEVRANVMSVLGMRDAERRGRLAEREVRALHAQAPDEIRMALQAFGHYRPVIRAALEPEQGRWRASYLIEPGPPVAVREVDLRVTGPGEGDARFRRLVEAFPLAPGDPLRHGPYQLGKRSFQDAAAEGGYLDAAYDTSEIRIDAARTRADLRLRFATGPRYRFGEVRFEQDVLKPEFLAGYAEFRRGDPIDVRELVKLQKQVGETPYFRSVEVVPRRDLADGLEVPVVVSLAPSRARRFTAGAGVGTDNGPHGRAGAEWRRLNRRAHRAGLELKVSRVERSVTGQYFVPWPYPRSELLTLSAAYEDLDPGTSASKTARAGAGLTRGRAWRQAYAIVFQAEDFTVGTDAGTSRLLMPEVSVSRVSANDRIVTTRGQRYQFRLRGAAENAGSDASFAQVTAAAKWVRSPTSRTRFITRADAGYTRTVQFRRLPPLIRFFAGGAQSVRGYGFRELGPRDGAGNAIGGESLVAGSAELELRVLEAWSVAGFYDLGNAMRSLRDPLVDGAGGGVRWRSPVGLVRADVGWALSEPGTPWRFHLTLGPDL